MLVSKSAKTFPGKIFRKLAEMRISHWQDNKVEFSNLQWINGYPRENARVLTPRDHVSLRVALARDFSRNPWNGELAGQAVVLELFSCSAMKFNHFSLHLTGIL